MKIFWEKYESVTKPRWVSNACSNGPPTAHHSHVYCHALSLIFCQIKFLVIVIIVIVVVVVYIDCIYNIDNFTYRWFIFILPQKSFDFIFKSCCFFRLRQPRRQTGLINFTFLFLLTLGLIWLFFFPSTLTFDKTYKDNK